MERKHQFNLWYAVMAMFAVLMFQSLWQSTAPVERIPYSTFETLLEDGAIARVKVGSDELQGDYTTARDGRTGFVTTRVDEDIAAKLAAHGVEYAGAIERTWFTDLLSWILPVLLFFGLWMFFFRKIAERQGMGGMMSVGRSRAKVYVEKDTKVTLDDVAGVDEAKEELAEIIEFLKNPEEYSRLGARIPKGILLVGPPGTGKTLLARAVAGEAGVTFFSISGAEFVEMFVGVGAARVRDLFEQARGAAPAIIFIDELDALGRARGASTPIGGHDEREQTLNQLLNELDGFDPSIGVVLLAATNRPEILDPALLRAGRFDRQVLVDKPDRTGRVAILKVHMKKAKIATDVDPDQIAALTTGFSGADLANLVNEAALLATRRKGKAVTMDDFTSAIERIVAGLEKRNRLMNPKEREIVAHHEMGHALVSLALPGSDVVHKVSIIPRGVGALGYTIQRPTEDRFLMTREELENKIAVLLGGRAAEKLIFDHTSTGAADDLAKATDIARAMVTRYGMDEALGHAAYDRDRAPFLGVPEEMMPSPRRFSEATAQQIDAGVKTILDAAFARALKSLTANRKLLVETAADLLERETLTAEDLEPVRMRLKPAGRGDRATRAAG
ncbi:MAG TPA: ATP-dependent zinc metalloprotease FtsH [Thermohalobaculum sp.]|nr:ATP-dependent zinc metalloprotease FtsH [Thermohalobaculum sp.]